MENNQAEPFHVKADELTERFYDLLDVEFIRMQLAAFPKRINTCLGFLLKETNVRPSERV